jgi:DNA-binding IclR family transcriptional regulator
MENQSMQAITRIFLLIEKVAESQNGLSISELSRAAGLPKTTVFRQVKALVDINYLVKDENERYKLGYKFIAIAKSYICKLDLREVAGPYVRQLSRTLNVTGHIAVRQGDSAVYVEKIQPYSYVCMYSEIGKSIDLYCSALGKSLMLDFSIKELKNYLERTNFEAYTDNTLTKEKLIKELEHIKKNGIAYDNAEHEEGVYCMSVPIYDYTDKIIGAISVTSADKDFLKDDFAVSKIKSCGTEISRRFGK